MLSIATAVLSYGEEQKQLTVHVFTKGPVGAVAKTNIEAHISNQFDIDSCSWEVEGIGKYEANVFCDQLGTECILNVGVDAKEDYEINLTVTGEDGQPYPFTGHAGQPITATVSL